MGRVILSVFLSCLCLIQSSSAMVYDTDTTFEESVSFDLKRSVLVEERTAVWCDICAEFDPLLKEVASKHGNRISIIGVHPFDGIDPFGNEASKQRMERHEIFNENLGVTPTFLVDGKMISEGYSAWGEVQQAIFSQENKRKNPDSYNFSLQKISDELTLNMTFPNEGIFSVMLLEHNKNVPKDASNPGMSVRDRVLIDMITIYANQTIINGTEMMSTTFGEDSLEIHFFAPSEFSVVIVHEPSIEEAMSDGNFAPYGVVEISRLEEVPDQNNITIFWIFIITLGAGGIFIWIHPQKSESDESE